MTTLKQFSYKYKVPSIDMRRRKLPWAGCIIPDLWWLDQQAEHQAFTCYCPFIDMLLNALIYLWECTHQMKTTKSLPLKTNRIRICAFLTSSLRIISQTSLSREVKVFLGRSWQVLILVIVRETDSVLPHFPQDTLSRFLEKERSMPVEVSHVVIRVSALIRSGSTHMHWPWQVVPE